MTRTELIKKVEELDRILTEEMETNELTDYTRFHAHITFENLVEILKENEE